MRNDSITKDNVHKKWFNSSVAVEYIFKMEQILQTAKFIGLQGKELAEFIENQQKILREERLLEREAKKTKKKEPWKWKKLN